MQPERWSIDLSSSAAGIRWISNDLMGASYEGTIGSVCGKVLNATFGNRKVLICFSPQTVIDRSFEE